MKHPEEFLAAYVDGDLDEAERARVDHHLATCAVCREEVALAGRARTELRGLPEVPVPLGVTAPVLREAMGEARAPREARRWLDPPRLYRLAGLAAAAAAVVIVFAVALPDLGRQAEAPTAERAEDVGGEAAGAPEEMRAAVPPLERLDRDFQPQDLSTLTAEAKIEAEGSPEGVAPAAPAAADAERALSCVRQGSDLTDEDQLVRLIEARFQGAPAYLAVALRGPGAGQPPTKVVIWVVATEDCSPLSFSQQRL